MSKQALKSLRVSQPFNRLVTEGIKRAFNGKTPASIIKHLPRSGITETTLPNGRSFKLWSKGDDYVSTLLFWKGWTGYEPETAKAFYHIAQRPGAIIDIGAFVGFFGLLGAAANPNAKVLSFEPLPSNYERLVKNANLNDFPNLTCYDLAISDADGDATFYSPNTLLSVSSSLSKQAASLMEDKDEIQVQTMTLDTFTGKHNVGRVNLIKMDTEGTEPDVLEGALGTIARDLPFIICEVHGNYKTAAKLHEFFKPLDYSFYALLPEGPVKKSIIMPIANYENWLFAPAG